MGERLYLDAWSIQRGVAGRNVQREVLAGLELVGFLLAAAYRYCAEVYYPWHSLAQAK